MKAQMGSFLYLKRLVLSAAVFVAVAVWGAEPACAQSNTLEFRILASTKEDTDKEAVAEQEKLFKAAKTDDKLKKQLEQLAKDGKAPNLTAEAEPAASTGPSASIGGAFDVPGNLADALASVYLAEKRTAESKPVAAKPGAYTWIKVGDSDLLRVGIRLNSPLKADKTLKKKIDDARDEKTPFKYEAKNLLLFSWKTERGDVEYFFLMRPKGDDTGIDGKDLKTVRPAGADQGAVLITLTADGTAKFKKFTEKITEKNKTPHLAILVKGDPVFVVRLTESIDNGELEISGQLTRQAAEIIAQKIESCKTAAP